MTTDRTRAQELRRKAAQRNRERHPDAFYRGIVAEYRRDRVITGGAPAEDTSTQKAGA